MLKPSSQTALQVNEQNTNRGGTELRKNGYLGNHNSWKNKYFSKEIWWTESWTINYFKSLGSIFLYIN